ncbi:hypothetical protein [uncultured Dechloromonas sp.]|uniref:hypothetical protein n=1 Tax=uncultured Dechloromonas sp. TaxID=171719 RepID=UPI0025FE7036|nr:hypothetical protein [uncultured Dechloromonas sp.]
MQKTFERKISLTLNDAGYGMQIRKGQFIDKAHLARHEFFAEIGWANVSHEGVACTTEVIQDTINYGGQAQILETLLLNLSLEHMADDRTSCVLRWDFRREDGQPVIIVCSELVWLRSDNGESVPAPAGLVDCLNSLPAAPGHFAS